MLDLERNSKSLERLTRIYTVKIDECQEGEQILNSVARRVEVPEKN